MDTEQTSAIQVIDRAVTLIDALARQDGPASLKVLSAEARLHPSTAFRILSSLTQHGLIGRDAGGRYQLGGRLSNWGDRARARTDIRAEARPVMEGLRDQVGETVNLTVREGDEVVYVERATARHAIRVEQVIGSRAPLHVTAVGKLMLAELDDAALRAYVRRTGLPAFTANTITGIRRLEQEIKDAVKNGYALDNEEAELGVGCIGVLIKDSAGNAVAGLSISAPIERRRQQWIKLVRQAGKQLSQRLGYQA